MQQLPKAPHVSSRQQLRAEPGAGRFPHDVQRARAQRFGEGTLEPRQPARWPARERHQLRQLELEPPHRRLALGAPLVQRTRRELVPRARIHEQEASPDRDVARLKGGALEQQRVPRPRQRRGHLVHDAARHADVVVLGPERHARDLPRVETRAGQQTQRLRRRNRQRRGRGEARAHRHVARDGHSGSGTGGRGTRRVQLAHDAGEVRTPPGGACVAPCNARPLPVARRDQLEHARVAGTDRHGGAQRRRHRQHGTAVVVGVLAQQVDAPGRRRHDPGRHTEGRAEQG